MIRDFLSRSSGDQVERLKNQLQNILGDTTTVDGSGGECMMKPSGRALMIDRHRPHALMRIRLYAFYCAPLLKQRLEMATHSND
jgi:hypothetical protein